MPRFSYRALSAAGQVEHGEVEAPDLPAATRSLQKTGATILRLHPAAKNRLTSFRLIGSTPRLTRAELTDVTRELAAMLAAGQDIDVALRGAASAAPNRRAAAVLTRLRDAVRDGASLTAALGRDPVSFPRLYIGLIRAGEAGGNLAETCERLATLLERSRSLQSAIVSAMIYPAILLVAATGSIFLLLTQVLPQFVPLFAENDVPLPPSTAFLLAAGNALSADSLYGFLALMAAVFAVRAVLRRPAVRLAADSALLRLPVAGPLLRDIAAAQFCRVFGSLLRNGVALLPALTVAQEVVSNKAAEAAIIAAAAAAKGGGGIAHSLAGAGIFPARAVALIQLGENTAQLGPMCLRAADLFEERIRVGLNRVVALLVPAITIAMGAAVAGIVSSLLLAMLSLNDVAQ
jgi:general secretion pathway protein F